MKLLSLIEDFDFYYAMSDDPRAFEEGQRKEREIQNVIDYLTPEQVLPFIKELWRREEVQRVFFRED